MSSVGIPGDPGQLLSSADQFAAIAQHLDDTQNQILGASNQATSSWQSQGAFAFTGASNWLQASVSNAGQGFEQAAIATRAYGNALQQAQGGWNKCNQELHQLQSDLQAANAQLAQAQATNAQRATANMAAAVFTAGLPSAGALFTPAPAALPMINTAPMQAHIDQLKLDIQRVQSQMRAFEADAEQAAQTYAGTLGVAQNKGGGGGGLFGIINSVSSAAEQVGSGLVAGVVGGVTGLLRLDSINSLGMRTPSSIRATNALASETYHHPGEVAKAMVDYKDLADGNFARWYGMMIPTVGALLAGGGLADEARLGSALDGLKLERTYELSNGTKLVIEKGVAFRNKGTVDALEGHMSMLPENVRSALRTVTVSKGPSPYDAYWAKEFKTPWFKASASAGGGEITFYNGSHTVTSGSFWHEMGHLNGNGGGGPIDVKSWLQAQQSDTGAAITTHLQHPGITFDTPAGEHPVLPGGMTGTPGFGLDGPAYGVTTYGASKPIEDWAESFRLYVQSNVNNGIATDAFGNRLLFSDLFPGRSALLDQLFVAH